MCYFMLTKIKDFLVLFIDWLTTKLFTALTLIHFTKSKNNSKVNIFLSVSTLFIFGSHIITFSKLHKKFYYFRHFIFYLANISIVAYFTYCVVTPNCPFLASTRPLVDLTYHIHFKSKRATTSFYVIVLLVCSSVTVTHHIINWSKSASLQCFMAMICQKLSLFTKFYPDYSQGEKVKLFRKYVNFSELDSKVKYPEKNFVTSSTAFSLPIHRMLQFILILECKFVIFNFLFYF